MKICCFLCVICTARVCSLQVGTSLKMVSSAVVKSVELLYALPVADEHTHDDVQSVTALPPV